VPTRPTVGCQTLRPFSGSSPPGGHPFSRWGKRRANVGVEAAPFLAGFQATRMVSAPTRCDRTAGRDFRSRAQLPSGLASTLGAGPWTRGVRCRSLPSTTLPFLRAVMAGRYYSSAKAVAIPALMEALREAVSRMACTEWEEGEAVGVQAQLWLRRFDFPNRWSIAACCVLLQQGLLKTKASINRCQNGCSGREAAPPRHLL